MTTSLHLRPALFPAIALGLLGLLPIQASALPLFARQTGQNCAACHAGGQFPELTAFGRLFKVSGYTLGERTLPLSAMALLSSSRVSDASKSADPGTDFYKNGEWIFPTASLFVGGKLTDHVGGFAQITYDHYATQSPDGRFHGHTSADNIDLRYADQAPAGGHDLRFGVSLNNNPSVTDLWNTAPAWIQYVPVPSPGSSQFIDGNAPYPGYASGGNLGGVSAYLYADQAVYAELGLYRTGDGLFRFMSAGVPKEELTRLKGLNPYWRLAINRSWNAHTLMLGASGMAADAFDDPLDTDPATVHRDRDLGFDAEYQYQMAPHTVTAQLATLRNHHRDSDAAILAGGGEATSRVTRAKLTYVYQSRYGGSLGSFGMTGGGDGTTRGRTFEAFWIPEEHLRLGAQYTTYQRFAGAVNNYDGMGRNAHDNNSLFLYAWGAY